MPVQIPDLVPSLQAASGNSSNTNSLRICVIGTGYVGLVSGACLASLGHSVTCVDRSHARMAAIEEGQMPFFEPGLEQLVAQGRGDGADPDAHLQFSSDLDSVVASADLVLIAVGTPMAEDGAQADLSQLYAAVDAAARCMRQDAVMVIKSTSPVGTGDQVQVRVDRLRPDARIAVASNPEFLREGSAIEDFLRPSRVVIGSQSPHATRLMRLLYGPLEQQGTPLVMTSRRTAELIKYAANSFLATKLAFINEMADLCEQIGVDVDHVALGMGLDPRIGSDYLRAGPGYGGSCLPKDLVALSRTANEHGSPLRIVESVIALNEQRIDVMIDKIRRACAGKLEGMKVAILGVAFKPDTDDVRAAPALALAAALLAEGANVRLSDPQALHHARLALPEATCVEDAYECAKGCDAIVVVTEWAQYRALDLRRLRAGVKRPILIDLRNIFDPDSAQAAGFAYTGLGRGLSSGGRFRKRVGEEVSA